MSLPTLTVVVPTQGRATLPRLLDSLRPEQQDGYRADVLIVADTHSPPLSDVAGIARQYGARYLEHDAGKHDQGYPQITLGYERAEGDYILCIGDDDVYEPGALGTIRRAIAEHGQAPYLFRVEMFPGQGCSGRSFYLGTIWKEPRLRYGDISTQCAVVPNVPDKMGAWTSDYDFIRQTVDLWGGAVWRPEVIARCY